MARGIQPRIIKECQNCQKQFEGIKVSKFCSTKCRKEFQQKESLIQNNLEYQNLIKNIDYVECEICGYKMKNSLFTHISKMHNLKKEDYIKQFPDTITMTLKEKQYLSDKWKGEKNPAYGHQGEYSPFSDKSLYHSKEKRKEIRLKANQNRTNYNTRLDYYLEKTNNDIDLAYQLLSERQTTFSLEKCIEKYGEVEGYQKWKERQEKWQITLNGKSDEEKARINKLKIIGGTSIGYSKIEKEIFTKLLEKEILIKRQLMIKRINNQYYAYDIYFKNKIIEINGDYWHANPIKYQAEQEIKYPGNKFSLAKDVWQKDKEKIDFAKSQGYDVLIIWESEYKKDKIATLYKCKQFLES